ncbi:heavy-metal-associated domain-containing protein [Paracoccus sp. MBLB3053]|uniref:Heavy-metal-associated domain-containing protein n=1 Tax=Paracoccus aurantius TaxID=3073814 RepID=A0ABU2HMY1_9RHOB|nr:heavy-metal-associated domain-containing protein [Paracoccus sp. MBLB3053]MDS9466127.1 heavy-metal-associated domain-containing protein [Paracoccus sp. MBLB3053]
MKLRVDDMSCRHCTDTIEKAISDAGGRASADLDSRTVEIESLDEARAMQVIREAGYEPQPA